MVAVAAMKPDTLQGFLSVIPFLVWCMAVAWLCLRRKRPVASGIGAGISATAGLAVYGSTAWLMTADPQGGLIFIFLPVYQFAFALLWLAGVGIVGRLISKDHV